MVIGGGREGLGRQGYWQPWGNQPVAANALSLFGGVLFRGNCSSAIPWCTWRWEPGPPDNSDHGKGIGRGEGSPDPQGHPVSEVCTYLVQTHLQVCANLLARGQLGVSTIILVKPCPQLWYIGGVEGVREVGRSGFLHWLSPPPLWNESAPRSAFCFNAGGPPRGEQEPTLGSYFTKGGPHLLAPFA